MTQISSIIKKLTPDTRIKGPMFNEPVIIITVTDLGDCASNPVIHIIRNPACLDWVPITQIAHYHVGSDAILGATN